MRRMLCSDKFGKVWTCSVQDCNTLQHTATHCNTLQCIRNTPRHTAKYCNTHGCILLSFIAKQHLFGYDVGCGYLFDLPPLTLALSISSPPPLLSLSLFPTSFSRSPFLSISFSLLLCLSIFVYFSFSLPLPFSLSLSPIFSAAPASRFYFLEAT